MKMHKGHYGKYTGNAKWSKDHAHTRVTKENYKASERDDAAHIDYLKRDVLYDEKHGHSDEKMTADEKHISKLAGDMKYDKEHHGSPAKNKVGGLSHAELKRKNPRSLRAHLEEKHGFKRYAPGEKEKIDKKEQGRRKPTDKEGTTSTEYAGRSQRPKPQMRYTAPANHINKFMDENHQHNKNHDERPMHSHKNFEKKKKKK